jgi:hypothetical protein
MPVTQETTRYHVRIEFREPEFELRLEPREHPLIGGPK